MKTLKNNSALRHCIVETLESRQMFAAGALDTLFSGDGKANMLFPNAASAVATDVAVQADGKTVVVGTITFSGGNGASVKRIGAARFNVDGTPDTTFGRFGNGTFTGFVGNKNNDKATAVAIQPDGKIVIVGSADMSRTGRDGTDFAVMRLNRDGSLDKTFAGKGTRNVHVSRRDAEANDVVIQKDGKIVIVGQADDSLLFADTDFAIARLNRDGGFDKSFSGDGKLLVNFGSNDRAYAVAVDERGTAATNPHFGKIVMVGERFTLDQPSFTEYGIVRLNRNGSFDTTFDKDGRLITKYPGYRDGFARDVLIQPDGRIVVAGHAEFRTRGADDTPITLSRFFLNGKIDKSFGDKGNGTAYIDFGGRDRGFGVIGSSDGGMIVAGTTDGRFAIANLTANGKLNTSFGKGGKVMSSVPPTSKLSSSFSEKIGIAQGPGRRFVVAGGKNFNTARVLEGRNNVISVVAENPSVDLKAAETVPGQTPRRATFIVDRSEALPFATRVFFNLSGTATNNVDYTTNLKPTLQVGPNVNIIGAGGAVSSTPVPAGQAFIDIPAGKTFATVTVSPKDDKLFEDTETATFSIVPNAGYEVSSLNRITATIEDNNDPILVNFQPAGKSPEGYLADVGQVFGDRGNGLRYGWDADNTANVRRRNNPRSIDERFDTLALMQKDGNRKWEIALPNGLYAVQLDAGDPDFTDSNYRMNLENRFVISGKPGGETRWFERSANILVTDGRLTLSNTSGASNNKVAFIHIRRAAPGAVEGPTTPNLPGDLAPPPGVAADPSTPAAPGNARIFSQILI